MMGDALDLEVLAPDVGGDNALSTSALPPEAFGLLDFLQH